MWVRMCFKSSQEGDGLGPQQNRDSGIQAAVGKEGMGLEWPWSSVVGVGWLSATRETPEIQGRGGA